MWLIVGDRLEDNACCSRTWKGGSSSGILTWHSKGKLFFFFFFCCEILNIYLFIYLYMLCLCRNCNCLGVREIRLKTRLIIWSGPSSMLMYPTLLFYFIFSWNFVIIFLVWFGFRHENLDVGEKEKISAKLEVLEGQRARVRAAHQESQRIFHQKVNYKLTSNCITSIDTYVCVYTFNTVSSGVGPADENRVPKLPLCTPGHLFFLIFYSFNTKPNHTT